MERSTLERWSPLLVFGVALAVRLVYLLDSSDNPTFFEPLIDAAKHNKLANAVAAGEGFDPLFRCCRPFFYPLSLSAVYSISGSSILAAKIVQALLGALTCALTFVLARIVFGMTTALLAASLVALNGPLVFWEAELVSAGWAAFWSVVVVLLLVRAGNRKTPSTLFFLGACGACALATRASFLLFILGACVWIGVKLVRAGHGPAWIATRLGAALLGFSLVALPIAVQSHRVTGSFGILPVSGGINTYIGNNPNRCETLAIRPGRDFQDLVGMSRDAGFQTRPQQSRFFYARVRAFAMEDPIAFASGLAKKALLYLNGREVLRNVDIYTFRQWSHFLQASVWKIGRFGFPWGLLLPFALLGLIVRWRDVPTPMVLFAALYPMVPILVFISSRYRAPAIPIFSILAALGIRSLCGWIRRKQGVRILAGAGFVIAAATVLSLPTPACEELPNYEVEIYALLASRAFANEDELQAEQFTRKALELDPRSHHANQLLGLIHASRGDFDPALARFDNAIEIKSDYWSHYLRGLLLAEMEDFVAAERDFRTAVSMNEKFIWGYLELGRCYDALGNEGEATKARKQLRRLRRGRAKLRMDSAGELRDRSRTSKSNGADPKHAQ